MRLQSYRIRVTFKKGTSLSLADTLSRSTLPTINDSKQTNFETFRLDIDKNLQNPRITSQTLEDIKACTAQDPALSKLNKIIIYGWPASKPHDPHPYCTFRD